MLLQLQVFVLLHVLLMAQCSQAQVIYSSFCCLILVQVQRHDSKCKLSMMRLTFSEIHSQHTVTVMGFWRYTSLQAYNHVCSIACLCLRPSTTHPPTHPPCLGGFLVRGLLHHALPPLESSSLHNALTSVHRLLYSLVCITAWL